MLSASQANGRRTIDYVCTCCGIKFVSGRTKAEVLCIDCIELRRTLRAFEKRGLEKKAILERAGRLL